MRSTKGPKFTAIVNGMYIPYLRSNAPGAGEYFPIVGPPRLARTATKQEFHRRPRGFQTSQREKKGPAHTISIWKRCVGASFFVVFQNH